MKKVKKIKSVLLAFAASCAVGACFVSCKSNDEPTPEPPEIIATIAFENTEISVELHESAVLKTLTENVSGEIRWNSSDPGVAAVDNTGKVSAKSAGTAVISAEADGAKAECKVTVFDSGVAPVLSVYPQTLSVEKGGKYQFTAEALWKGSKIEEEIEYSWRVSDGFNENVAAVRSLGNGVSEIEGLEYGDTQWTVSADVFGFSLAQNVTVRVCDASVSYRAGKNVNYTEDGFGINLSLLENYGVHSSGIDVSVYENENKADVALDWLQQDGAEYVKYENGVLTALKEGRATFAASYKNNPVYLTVEAYRPEIRTGETVFFERKDGAGTGVAYLGKTEIEGEATGAKVGNVSVFSSYAENALTYQREALPESKSEMGANVLIFDTDKARYIFDCECYTEVIENKDELYAFGTNRPTDGYYVLGCDIKGADAYPTEAGSWGWTFNGIFDGRGFAIDEFQNKGAGLIYALGQNGILRNISFTNAVQGQFYGSYHALITHAGSGTFENIYVHVNRMVAASKLNGRSGVFCVAAYAGTVPKKVKNVFVIVDGVELSHDGYTAEGTAGIFGYMNLDDRVMENLYVIAPENCPVWVDSFDTGKKNGDVYGKYQSREEMLASGNNYKPMISERFWILDNGLPYPAKLERRIVSKIYNETEIGAAGEYTVDVSDVADSGSPIGVTVGGAEMKNYRFAEGKLTLDKSELSKTVFGFKDVALTFDDEQGRRVVSSSVLYITKKIGTVEEFNAIGTYAKEAAGENGGSRYDGYFVLTADLDFESDRTKYTSEISNAGGKAFYGTIDGRGHKFLNLTITTKGTYGWSMCFIGKLGDGATVKNLGFINTQFGTASEAGGDTFFTSSNSGVYNIENIYLELSFGKVTWNAQAFGGCAEKGKAGFKAKNVFVKIDEPSYKRYFAFNLCVTDAYLQGVYFVSNAPEIGLAQNYKNASGGKVDAPDDKEIYGVYASVEAMKAANNDYSEFEKSGCWTIVDGLPVFGK